MKELLEIPLASGEVAVLWKDYSSFTLKTRNHLIIFDPADTITQLEINELTNVSLLIYTHDHYDHYSEVTARRIYEKTSCPIVADPTTASKIEAFNPDVIVLKPGQSKEINGIKVTAVAGVHIGEENLYGLNVDDIRVFFGGDSGYSKDIQKIGSVDLAVLPAGTPSPTASPQDAQKMAETLVPKIVIPIHGTPSEMETLKKLIEKSLLDTKTVILEKEIPQKVKVK